jgi:predicted DsbA family dithiol-disulfide isomerase
MDLAEHFGGAARVEAMHAHLAGFARGFGIADMKLRDRAPNTRRALAVAEYARDAGRLEQFRQAAMDAHWRRGMDLESDADLSTLAVECGLDPASSLAASRDPSLLARIDQRREAAEQMGVTGIPTFVIGDRAVVGCQGYEVLARFVEACGARRKADQPAKP